VVRVRLAEAQHAAFVEVELDVRAGQHVGVVAVDRDGREGRQARVLTIALAVGLGADHPHADIAGHPGTADAVGREIQLAVGLGHLLVDAPALG
jgi:hypothetical protein